MLKHVVNDIAEEENESEQQAGEKGETKNQTK